MRLLMTLILLCGFGAASASADTSGARRKTQQQRDLERELKELIDSIRLDPDWNRPHVIPPIRPTTIDFDRLNRDPLKR